MNEVVPSDAPSISPALTWTQVEALVVPPPAAAAEPTPIMFAGARPVFRRLIIRGAFLELITLGFYRFWLATDIRRHLWSNTSIDGDALEYTGTAKELLIGFLFALAILVPVYLAYFLIGLQAEHLQTFASLPLGVFFFFFYQFAMYRARRYRLSRTIWRGVRFWMTGSGWAYAFRAGLWTFLVIITAGLALPWYQASLERYKMKHSHFGSLAGGFDGTGWQFFKRAVWVWALAMFMLTLLALSAVLATAGQYVSAELVFLKGHERVVGVTGLIVLSLLIAVGAPWLYASYKAAEWRWWVAGMHFGEVRFHSSLIASNLTGLYWKVIGWSVLIFLLLMVLYGAGGYLIWHLAGTAGLSPETFTSEWQVAFTAGILAPYLIAALIFGAVVRLYLRRDVWARVAATSVVHNIEAAANVAARGDAAGALGEGFADSLDIGGI